MLGYDERPVVVGVPDDDAEDALRFAAQEAAGCGSPLRVVHSHEAARSASDEAVLHRAVARASELAGPGTPVTGQLVAGVPVAAVLTAFPQARTVVLRRRDVLHLVHTLTSERAATIRTPVVCVPLHWKAAEMDRRPVAVGVEDAADAAALVREAAERAAALGAPLRVVHVCAPGRLGPRVDERASDERDAAVRADLERAVAACAPTVLVTIELDHGSATRTLMALAHQSQLLVVGRNAPTAEVGSRMGRTARTLLHQSEAPLLILPPTRPRTLSRNTVSPGIAWGRAEAPVLA